VNKCDICGKDVGPILKTVLDVVVIKRMGGAEQRFIMCRECSQKVVEFIEGMQRG
jgi:hypothetical protein